MNVFRSISCLCYFEPTTYASEEFFIARKAQYIQADLAPEISQTLYRITVAVRGSVQWLLNHHHSYRKVMLP